MVSRSNLHFVTRARRGDAAAQFALGKLYLEGSPGLPRNHAVALDWLLRARRQGISEASGTIARSIESEVARDSGALAEILGILRQHAEDGDPIAQASYFEIVAALPDDAVPHGRSAAGPAAHHVDAPAHDVIASPSQGVRADWTDCAPLLLAFYRATGWADPLGRDALIAAAEAGLTEAQFEFGRLQFDAAQLNARNKVPAHDHEAIVRLVSTGAAPRPPVSLRAAVRWLTLAAEQGHPDATYLLGILYRIPAFSKRNVGVSNVYLRRAADLGQRDAAYRLGTHLWRARDRSDGADAESVAWLIAAADAGHTLARQALDAIAPIHAAPDSYFNRFEPGSIGKWARRHPLMAERIALGRAFRLKRIEALLVDVRAADRGRFLVLDLSAWTSKHARRFVRVVTGEQRLVLAHAARTFRDVESGPAGPEGGYRQRLYLLNKLVKEEAVEEAVDLAVR